MKPTPQVVSLGFIIIALSSVASSSVAQGNNARLETVKSLAAIDLRHIVNSSLPDWSVVSLAADAESGTIRTKSRIDPGTKVLTIVSTSLPLDTGQGQVKAVLHGGSSIHSFHYKIPAIFRSLAASDVAALDHSGDPFEAGGVAIIGGRLSNPLLERPVFVLRVPTGDAPLIESAYRTVRANAGALEAAGMDSNQKRIRVLLNSDNPYVLLATLQVLRPAQEEMGEDVVVPQTTTIQGAVRVHGDHPVQQSVASDSLGEPYPADTGVTASIRRSHGLYLSAMIVCYLQGMTLASQSHDETVLKDLIDIASPSQKKSISDAFLLVKRDPELIRGVQTVHSAMFLKYLRPVSAL